MKFALAALALVAIVSAKAKSTTPAHMTRFEAALQDKAHWSTFRSENMAHLKASKAHRARRNGLVQKYFDAKKAQGVTAKAVAAAKKVRVTATGKWRAAQAVDRKASAYSAKMLAAKNKRNTELSAAKSQQAKIAREQASLVAAAKSHRRAHAAAWKAKVNTAQGLSNAADAAAAKAKAAKQKAHGVLVGAKAAAAEAKKQQELADTADQKAIGAANSAKQNAVDAHQKYVKFIKAGASRGMIH